LWKTIKEWVINVVDAFSGINVGYSISDTKELDGKENIYGDPDFEDARAELIEKADDLMEDLDRIGSIEPVQPRLSVSDHSVRILVPGDDGYEAAADDERRPDVLTRLSAVVAAGGDVPPDFGPVR